MPVRGHEPIPIEDFNGLWRRGDPEAAPPDHFADCQNIQFIQSGFKTRDGLDTYEAYPKVLRIYTYVYLQVPNSFESLLILDDQGNIYHDKSPTPFVPILSIPGMTDFGFIGITGYAYINPCNGSTGLQNEFVYVYRGDGQPARKAAGNPPTGTLSLANTGSGNVEAGVHVLAVAFETNTGYITQIAGFQQITAPGGENITVSSIPVSSDPFVVARRLVSTVAIDPTLFTGDLENGYEFFFIPDGRIADNTTTSLVVSYFDSELLEDASYLLNLFNEIPAGVGFTSYHNRMVSFAEYENISLARVSYVGQPEAMDQVTGLLIIPLDSFALTNGAVFQDVLYMFKQTRTFAYNDSGDVPSTWPLTIIDGGIGASVHGVGTVLDSETINITYLLVIDYSGVMLFNGVYIRPELSWKIKDLWQDLDRSAFLNIQIMNDSIEQVLYITLPNKQMILGDYSNGMDFQNIRWAPMTFDIETTTITMINTNQLIIGSHALFTP